MAISRKYMQHCSTTSKFDNWERTWVETCQACAPCFAIWGRAVSLITESKPLHDSEAAGAFAGTRRAVPGGTVESHKALSFHLITGSSKVTAQVQQTCWRMWQSQWPRFARPSCSVPMQTTQTACFWLLKVLGSFGKYAWLQADFSWSFMFSESKFQIFGQRSQGRRFHQLPLREQHFVLSLAGLVIVPSLVSGTAQEIIFGEMGRPWKARTCDHVRNQLGDDRQVLFLLASHFWHLVGTFPVRRHRLVALWQCRRRPERGWQLERW